MEETMASGDEDRRTGLAVKLAAIVAGLLLAAFAFAACGGDDEGNETDTAATETTKATETTGAEGGGADGKQLFVDSGCPSCHTLAAAGATGTVGPNLDEFAPDLSVGEIRNSIVNPDDKITQGFSAGVMPQNYGEQLSQQQIDTLANYIHDNAGS
jgi:mono/diheme cytochrome c family protein